MLLAEWHLPPEYILDNWTEEELNLMVGKFADRRKRENDAMSGRTPSATPAQLAAAGNAISYKAKE